MKVTVSLIKADVGGYPGHMSVHPKLMDSAVSSLSEAKNSGLIMDFHVGRCGDDIDLIMTHTKGVDNSEVHSLAWNTFRKCTEVAKSLNLYGAGQDLLSDAFSGNVRGMGPGIAEMEFEERKGEPIICFLMDKTDPGAFNIPIFRMFADPFCTPGLVLDPKMMDGFSFEVYDTKMGKKITLSCPSEMYKLLAFIGSKGRYVIKRIFSNSDRAVPKGEPVACISTEKLAKIAGKYVGKDDPAGIVRCQAGLPSLGEALEPFSYPYIVSGWMRGSHQGPLVPCSVEQAMPSRLDGPPRVVALGFQLSSGHLVGPVDLFKDIAWDYTRKKAMKIAEVMRRHGPFEPHRLPEEDLEYTNLPRIQEELKDRWTEI